MFGIDVLAPQKFGSASIDLVVSGPNEGQNNGPFVFTLSGTVGATYVSVERGVSPDLDFPLMLKRPRRSLPSRSPQGTVPTALSRPTLVTPAIRPTWLLRL